MSIKDKLKKIKILKKIKNKHDVNIRFENDKKQFLENWIESSENDTKRGYKILLLVHSLEKGMTSKKMRQFGYDKIKNIAELLNNYSRGNIDFAFISGVNAIRAYCEIYEKNNWTEKEEYLFSIEELKKYEDIKMIPVGSHKLYLNDFINDSKIDFEKFLKSRHSVRNFKKNRISQTDFEKAVKMATYTPTACNRQMCKFYYIKNELKREQAIKFGNGLTNFQLENTNIILVSYDISSFCFVGDRNQGWFNAGLVSMNFVNALHSLGIGSCFIQFGNDYENEKKLKELIGIPSNEKIAVMIAAGYYDEISTIPYSSRKEIEEISRVIS